MTFEFRHGDWQDVLADVEADSTIADPPYGSRTHEGHNAGSMAAINGFEAEIDYTCWTPDDVHAFVRHWSPRTRDWIVGMTSHDLWSAWESAYADAGRYAFAPIPYVDYGKGPRVVGDGPASWAVYIMVGRPKSSAWLSDWRRSRKSFGLSCSLDGAYLRAKGDVVWSPRRRAKRIGGKPIGLMRALVSDYATPGGLVCDPYAGHATTLRAAIELGRRAIGAERDREVWADGLARLEQPVPLDMFAPRAVATDEQESLF